MWLTISTIASGLLYKAGGEGKPFNTKWRDFGIPIICLLYLLFVLYFPVVWWIHLISAVLLFASLCTYWDSLFGYDNYLFHSFMNGMAYIAYPIASGKWLGFSIRCVIMALVSHFVCKKSGNVWVEEGTRGAIIAITLPLLLI